MSAIKGFLNKAGEKISEDSLIKFDYKVLLFLGCMLVLLVLSVTFKIHRSSIGQWERNMPQASQESSVLLGEPKGIRSDEWLKNTSLVISQYWHGFPIKNESIGSHNDPLLLGMPSSHFSAFFKPHDWGYFLFAIERGFAFFWGYKVFALIASFFMLLMLVTGNNFLLSLAGSLWLYFTSFIQWWFSTSMPEILIAFSMICISLAYVFLSNKKTSVIIGVIVLVVYTVNFILFFYPPFQIPVFYLMLFLLAGLLLEKDKRDRIREHFLLRAAVLGGAAVLVSVVVFFFYQDVSSTVSAISETVYPGERRTTGGDVSFLKLFSGFTLVPYGQDRFPEVWKNACEASGFILFFPVIVVAAARRLFLKRSNRLLIYFLSAYVLVLFVWIIFGFPSFISKLSLFSLVTAKRSVLGLGVGSILLTMVFLSQHDGPKNGDRRFTAGLSLVVFAILTAYGLLLKDLAGDFFRYRQLLLMSGFFAVVSYLLLNKRRLAFSLAIVLATAMFTFLVNPVSAGMNSIFGKDVWKAAVNIKSENPESKWLAYGGNILADFLKTSGLDVVNGSKYTPDLEFYRALNPGRESEAVYNRNSTVVFGEPEEGSEKDVEFVLIQIDSFAVLIEPCSQKLEELGITNFAFAYKPAAETVSCLEPITGFEESNIWFFRRKM